MKRIAVALVASLVVAGSVALAQSTTRTTLVAVDGVRIDGVGDLYVTGVLDGASESVEWRFRKGTTNLDFAECRRFALLAMTKPGQYRLSLATSGAPQISPAFTYASDCKLERVAP